MKELQLRILDKTAGVEGISTSFEKHRTSIWKKDFNKTICTSNTITIKSGIIEHQSVDDQNGQEISEEEMFSLLDSRVNEAQGKLVVRDYCFNLESKSDLLELKLTGNSGDFLVKEFSKILTFFFDKKLDYFDFPSIEWTGDNKWALTSNFNVGVMAQANLLDRKSNIELVETIWKEFCNVHGIAV